MENEIFEINEITETTQLPANEEAVKEKTTEKKINFENMKIGSILHKIVFTAFAIILFASVSSICNKIRDYGLDIAYIRSVGGKTLEEAYYSAYGHVIMFFSDFMKLLTAGISGIILCITYKK